MPGSGVIELTANGTTTVKTGPGVLLGIVVNLPGAGTIRIFDNTAASGRAIAGGAAAFALPAAGSYLPYNCSFYTGLTVVIASMTTGSISLIFE